MIICYFGIYKSGYSRNKIIIKGLKQNGIKVIECGTDKQGVAKYFDLISKHWKIRNQYDLIIVGFPGQQSMILAKLLTGKKIIFDAFTSLYDSLVFDRKIVRSKSLKAAYYWLLDWLSCCLADKILLDTNEQIKYFVKTFKINKEKFIRIFVGSDDEYMKPEQGIRDRDYFLVHFHGSFIPLQGVECIIKAAKVLENKNIKFRIIGTKIKEKYKNIKLKNIQFLDDVPYERLGKFLSEADAALGIFGNTDKAKRVIPNKAYEALAAKSAIITSDTAAIRELLADKENVLLCKIADSQDLAKKILELKNNNELKNKIAQNGYILFKEKLIPKKIVKQLIYEFKL